MVIFHSHVKLPEGISNMKEQKKNHGHRMEISLDMSMEYFNQEQQRFNH